MQKESITCVILSSDYSFGDLLGIISDSLGVFSILAYFIQPKRLVLDAKCANISEFCFQAKITDWGALELVQKTSVTQV